MSLVAGTPTWSIMPGEAARIDAQVCDESTCSACGHVSMRYEPFVDHEECRYVAFAACPACGHREEF